MCMEGCKPSCVEAHVLGQPLDAFDRFMPILCRFLETCQVTVTIIY